MQLDRATQWLSELCGAQSIESLTVHGGEPFLYFDKVAAILSKARELGIHHRWIITNGFWAENGDVAGEKLKVLKEAGLTAITFSIDAFHQEYVPFDRVRCGIECAVKLDFDTVAVDSYFLFNQHDENRYNIETMGYIDGLERLQKVEINRFVAGFEGRASELLPQEEYMQERIPAGRCRPPFWLGGDLRGPKTIEMDYEGNVTLCPGISIGNVREKSISEILRKYDYREHPIIKIIIEKGPIGLFELAKLYGYDGNGGFIDECHLCYKMRKYLFSHFRQYLAPAGCYQA